MKQTPDLSAILKGQLKSLGKKKSVPAADSESADAQGDDPPRVATPVANDDGPVDGESTCPDDEPSEVHDGTAQQKSSKKKKGKKRSREAPSGKEIEDLNASREDPVEPIAKDPSEERSKKKRREPAAAAEQSFSRQEDPPLEGVTPNDPEDTFARNEREGDEFVPAPDDAPDAAVSKQKKAPKKRAAVSRSAPPSGGAGGNASVGGLQMNFPDLVNFSYNENTLLISNPVKCAELTRQVRSGPTALPPVDKLYFKDDYIEAAHIRKLSDGVMNRMVERYETELRHTQALLGVSENSARAAEAEVARVRRMHEIAAAKAVEDKEILRVKFESLQTKLLNSRSAVKNLGREKISLERERKELTEERDAAVAKLISERKRLRDSRVYEVTLERARVETAMVVKAQRRFDNIRDYSVRRDEFEEAHNLFGQASGTRKCFEAAKEEGFEIPQELIDLYRTQEDLYKAKMDELKVGDIPEADLSLSPLILSSTFVSEEVLAGLDKYGTNDSFIDPETLVRMQSPDDSFDTMMKERGKGSGVATQGATEEPGDVQGNPMEKEAPDGKNAAIEKELSTAEPAGSQDPTGQGEDTAC
ncbi:Uncharacterized protein Rs2_02332 [Raphanus sativus]|nr:Uncharacterized protein Rs2_02332 [Raphanus sativus]